MGTRRMNPPFISGYGPYDQQGVALFISLVVLIVITLLGMSSIQTTTLQQKMTANQQLSAFAFQGAEAALTDAERQLETASHDRPYIRTITDQKGKGSGGKKDLKVWEKNKPKTDKGSAAWWYTVDDAWWSQSNKRTVVYSYPVPMIGLNQQPLYLIESLVRWPPVNYYGWEDYPPQEDIYDYHRITARATAGNKEAYIMLQSTHKWQYNR